MFNYETFKQKSPQQRFLFILGLVMFCFYLVFGAILIFRDQLIPMVPAIYRILLGCLFIVYGVIRFVRLINQKPDEN